ncbi:type II toxin-antitoxin system RelE family toxin [Methanospirillum lacunae]|uniref:Plasmid stabilization protein n=1 Tax=Methanospirillum lacunae TaxID=668570 RepID=A0A2V2MN34_9EURY|nr:type II toxin-antitoxin system RelE/ParE family toxin [Methanospirillum lacunae]PWR69664.1 plasmid stabilization protein [Methanospirillum lacunae]
MTEFQIIYSNKAKRNLKKIPLPIAQEIIRAIHELKSNPWSHVQKLEGSEKAPFHSLQVGGYRAILSIQNNKLIVYVVEVGPRKTIYRKY